MEEQGSRYDSGDGGHEGWTLKFILQALFRHWRLIVLIAAACAVISGAGSLLLSSKYETRAVLEIGQYKAGGDTRFIVI